MEYAKYAIRDVLQAAPQTLADVFQFLQKHEDLSSLIRQRTGFSVYRHVVRDVERLLGLYPWYACLC